MSIPAARALRAPTESFAGLAVAGGPERPPCISAEALRPCTPALEWVPGLLVGFWPDAADWDDLKARLAQRDYWEVASAWASEPMAFRRDWPAAARPAWPVHRNLGYFAAL